jgi:hypothetical protein
MKRILILLVAISFLLCSTAGAFQGGGGESTRKGSTKKKVVPKKKKSNVRLPKELILQMARDNDRVKSCLQEEGGNAVTFAAKNLSAHLLDLNRDGKQEWLIEGEGCFCGNRTCASWIYREVAGKYELLLEDGVPLDTFSNGYKDLQVGYGPWIPTIYTYDGRHYKEGYSFTLDQIIMPSKRNEIKQLVCSDSKKRLVLAKNNYVKKDTQNSWHDKGWSDDKSYEDKWQEKMKRGCREIQLEKTFKVSNDGISFYCDTTIGFPMAILSEEPSSEYFYSWAVLKPFLMPSSPISALVK